MVRLDEAQAVRTLTWGTYGMLLGGLLGGPAGAALGVKLAAGLSTLR